MSDRLRARWVFPVDVEPIENGIVEVSHGKIAGISAAGDPRAIDLGNTALLPGLVNAHTHLELSDLDAPLEPRTPFSDWLESVIAHRRRRATDGIDVAAAVRAGCAESLSTGTTLVGDIVSSEWEAGWLPDARPGTIAFLELLGLTPERIAPQLEAARRHLRTEIDSVPEVIRGLSPHAPYSVHPELFHRLVDLASQSRAPLAMHLAETRAELELLADGTGPFVAFLSRLGAWRPDAIPSGTQIIDYLRPMARLDRALVVHGNYLAASEIRFLAQAPGISVVYCPRTHAFFGHEPHPWQTLLTTGINVALGTDSRASNPDLNLWNEILFLREAFPDVSPATLLELGTRRGARALGREEHLGTLTPGKRADLTLVSLPENDPGDPYRALLSPESRPARLDIGFEEDCRQ